MYASMDIKTAFDVARPKHVAKFMGDESVHVWIVAAFLLEMVGCEGRATFENVECTFPFTRCVRQGGAQTPRLWLKMAMQISWNVEEDGKKTGRRGREEEEDGAPH